VAISWTGIVKTKTLAVDAGRAIIPGLPFQDIQWSSDRRRRQARWQRNTVAEGLFICSANTRPLNLTFLPPLSASNHNSFVVQPLATCKDISLSNSSPSCRKCPSTFPCSLPSHSCGISTASLSPAPTIFSIRSNSYQDIFVLRPLEFSFIRHTFHTPFVSPEGSCEDSSFVSDANLFSPYSPLPRDPVHTFLLLYLVISSLLLSLARVRFIIANPHLRPHAGLSICP